MPTSQWVVSKFIEEHNHDLATPSKAKQQWSYSSNYRSADIQHLICRLNVDGLGPPTIAQISNIVSNSIDYDNKAAQCRQIVRNMRRNNIAKECYGIITYFKSKQEEDKSHYFAMDLDNDRKFKSVFWEDGRSRVAYFEIEVRA